MLKVIKMLTFLTIVLWWKLNGMKTPFFSTFLYLYSFVTIDVHCPYHYWTWNSFLREIFTTPWTFDWSNHLKIDFVQFLRQKAYKMQTIGHVLFQFNDFRRLCTVNYEELLSKYHISSFFVEFFRIKQK